MTNILVIGLVPLIEQITQELKQFTSFNKFPTILSLFVSLLLCLGASYLLNMTYQETLLYTLLNGGLAAVFHQGKKVVTAMSGDPEVDYSPVEESAS